MNKYPAWYCCVMPQTFGQGGVTPSIGDIEGALLAVKGSRTKVHVLIRPRPGDFVYSSLEKQVQREADTCCNSIVRRRAGRCNPRPMSSTSFYGAQTTCISRQNPRHVTIHISGENMAANKQHSRGEALPLSYVRSSPTPTANRSRLFSLRS